MQVKNEISKELAKLRPDEKRQGAHHYNMKIMRDGTWFHEGRPIQRHALVKLFSTVLKRDPRGQHWLVTPVERGKIDVEDSAFVSRDLRIDEKGSPQSQTIHITNNVDQDFTIGPDCTLVLRTDENGIRIPYVQIEKNLEVRLTRTHFYMLAVYAVEDPEDPNWLGIWSQGAFYRLGHMDDS